MEKDKNKTEVQVNIPNIKDIANTPTIPEDVIKNKMLEDALIQTTQQTTSTIRSTEILSQQVINSLLTKGSNEKEDFEEALTMLQNIHDFSYKSFQDKLELLNSVKNIK